MKPLRSIPLFGLLVAFFLPITNFGQAAPDPSKGARQPDLRIGVVKSAQEMRGNDIYNQTARGQQIRLRLEGVKWSSFFFALENDGNKGNKNDKVRLKATRSNRVIQTKYYRLGGGRQNITAQITRRGRTENMSESQLIRYQAMVRYHSPSDTRNQKVTVAARSLINTTLVDAVRARVRG